MLRYRAAGIYSDVEEISFAEAQSELESLAESTFAGSIDTQPIEFSRHQAGLGKEIILDHPIVYTKNAIKSVLNLYLRPLRSHIDLQLGLRNEATTLTNWGEKAETSFVHRFVRTTSLPTIIVVIFQILMLLLLWGLIVYGIVKLVREKRFRELSLIVTILLYFSIVASGPEAYARFRVPLVPFLAAYAAIAASYVRIRPGAGVC